MSELFNFPFTQSIFVAYRDLDTLGHVNNVVYLSYFEDIRIRYMLHLTNSGIDDVATIVAENRVQYLKPVLYNEQLVAGVRIGRIGTKSLTLELALHRPADDQIVATGTTVLVWYDYAAGQSVPVPDAFREAVGRVQGST